MKPYYIHPETGKIVSTEEYFAYMFGEEFMSSKDKGTLKEYTA